MFRPIPRDRIPIEIVLRCVFLGQCGHEDFELLAHHVDLELEHCEAILDGHLPISFAVFRLWQGFDRLW